MFLKCNNIKTSFVVASGLATSSSMLLASAKTARGGQAEQAVLRARVAPGEGQREDRASSSIPFHRAVPSLPLLPEMQLLYLCFASQPLKPAPEK